MGNYILCQHKRADKPFYIENISTNIFSIEELCFYFYNNIYLLDETILNVSLCEWIKEELKLVHLTSRLLGSLPAEGTDEVVLEQFLLPVFKEIHYLNQAEYKELGQKLDQLAGQPASVRQKLKGDYLVHYGKFINGIKVYQKILNTHDDSHMGGQFRGSVYHNMGCAYARLFQMEEALACLEKANELLHTKAVLKSLLYAVYIAQSPEAYEARAQELGVDEKTKAEMDAVLQSTPEGQKDSWVKEEYEKAQAQKQQGDLEGYHHSVDALLEQMTEEYHKNTGF